MSLKTVARNSLELISIDTGVHDVSRETTDQVLNETMRETTTEKASYSHRSKATKSFQSEQICNDAARILIHLILECQIFI